MLLSNSRHKADLEFVLAECLKPLQTDLATLKAQNAFPAAEERLLASLGSGNDGQTKVELASLEQMRTAADTHNPNAATSHEVMLAYDATRLQERSANCDAMLDKIKKRLPALAGKPNVD